MKTLYSLTLLLFICAFHASGQFITVWKTDNPGSSASNEIFIPATGTNYNIAWEEVGNPTNNGSDIGSGYHTLAFPGEGTYQVSITPGSGTFTGITFFNGYDRLKIIEVRQWGNTQWETMENAYFGCANMTITATDIPDLQNVTSTFNMFNACTSLTSVPGMNSWNVSNVTNMQGMFFNASNFNEPIGNWNVGNVVQMSRMFAYAAAFNQPIGGWNVGNVFSTSTMFYYATSFNQPIGNWNVSKVGPMGSMFQGASSFNQPIGNWKVGSVYDMNLMFFQAASFNQPVNDWDVSKVTGMYGMFALAGSFNQSLSNWPLTSVTNMSDMLTVSAMDCANMSRTLRGWAENPASPDNITFGADGITYGLPAATALETLRNNKGWTITIGDAVVCEALDVSLIRFDAKISNGTVNLEWATASETDHDYFEVERSPDARNWNAIGRAEGAGTVNSVRNYSLTDLNPLEGISYYRLKIVDLARKADYSKVRAVNRKIAPALSVYPNPATSSITVSGKANGFLKVYNLSGRQVLQTEVKTDKTHIPLNGLPAGAYIIKSDDGWHSKFIKTN